MSVELYQEWHCTHYHYSYLIALLKRNAFLVLGNHVYNGCDSSKYVDKDCFAIACLMTLQKLTYYFTRACSEHIYFPSGELCRINIVLDR